MLAGIGSSIVERFWQSFVTMLQNRMQSQVPTVVAAMQKAEATLLGTTGDITVNPVVQDVFHAMQVAGLLVLAFCTVISLAELAESGLMGSGGSLIGWFKRFFVATLMTFGGLQFYAIWIRLFDGAVTAFRSYLDSHWSGSYSGAGDMYTQFIKLLDPGNLLITLLFAALVIVILLIVWFLVGGVRVAELMLAVVIAPIVWPVYMISSLEDIPKTAFRNFLGLNVTLLFTVAMFRMAVRMAFEPVVGLDMWGLIPALAMLGFTIFLPAMIKRIVGQGHTGVAALMTEVQLAAGLKFLAAGAGLGAAAGGVSPPAGNAIPQAPVGASAYPLATMGPAAAGFAGPGAAAAQPMQARGFLGSGITGLPTGAVRSTPTTHQLQRPFAPHETIIDLGESTPGSGEFDTIVAIRAARDGELEFLRRNRREEDKT